MNLPANITIVGVIIWTLAISACRHAPEISVLCSQDSLVLQTDWRYSTSYSGLFTESITGEEYIYTGDPITHLKIRVFDSQGTTICDVPLISAIDSLADIGAIVMTKPNQFFIMEERGAAYVIIDTLGNVIKKRSLKNELCDQYGDLYELYGGTSKSMLREGKIYLETDWAGTCTNPVAEWQAESEFDYVLRYFAEATGKCKIAELWMDADSGGLRFGACNLLTQHTDTPRFTIGSAHCVYVNHKLMAYSPYSEHINILNSKTLALTERIQLSYVGGKTGFVPPPVSQNDIDTDGHSLRSATKSQIMSLSYDKLSENYLVAIVHEVPENVPENERSFHRNWSLIVMDSTYKVIVEHVIAGDAFLSVGFLNRSDGTWLLKTNTGRVGTLEPKIFYRLNLP